MTNLAKETKSPRRGAGAGQAALKLIQVRELSLILILAIMVIFLMFSTTTFLKVGNIRVLLQGMSVDMMIAVPMAISLIAGNIDFSVGSTLCLTSAVAGLAMNSGVPFPLAMLIGLGMGGVLGFVNAFIINRLQLTPLVATLGTWMAYRGIALVVVGGSTLGNFDPRFLAFGRVEIFGIPVTILYMAMICAAGLFLIKYNNFLHNAYFIGSNKDSARLAGIHIERFTYVTYIITGVVAAFAGLVLAARLGSSSQNAGDGLEFRNVVGLLVGGISMDGGEGKIIGAILGVMIMQVVNNAIVLLYLNPSYTQVITGGILVLTVAVDKLSQKSRQKA